MEAVIMGIDCGDGGGAVLSWGENRMTCHPTPTHKDGELNSLVNEVLRVKKPGIPLVVYVERIGGYVGGRPMPGARMFTMGRAYEYCFGVFDALGITYHLIEPRKWQEWCGIPLGLAYTPRKRRSREIVLKRFPWAMTAREDGAVAPIHRLDAAKLGDVDRVCDAANIAVYGRFLWETYGGKEPLAKAKAKSKKKS